MALHKPFKDIDLRDALKYVIEKTPPKHWDKHRQHMRVKFDNLTADSSELGTFRVSNLSTGGLFGELNQEIPIDQELSVILQMPHKPSGSVIKIPKQAFPPASGFNLQVSPRRFVI